MSNSNPGNSSLGSESLLQRIGGPAALDLAVEKFYDRVLQDERIRHFFAQTDMKAQRAHQKAFLAYALGGAPDYGGRAMRAAHGPLVEKLGLTDVHFDAVVENLGLTLRELGVPESLVAEVAAVAETTRADVLNR